MRWRIGVVAVALVAAACGGSGGSVATTSPSGGPAPTQADQPLAEGSYETLRAMQLAVEKSFHLCNSPLKVYDPPEVEGAAEQADCSSAVGLFLFDPADVGTGAADIQASADGPLALIIGTNWIITCVPDAAPCERIHGETGGELINPDS